jgi:hypothetical protein
MQQGNMYLLMLFPRKENAIIAFVIPIIFLSNDIAGFYNPAPPLKAGW